MDPRPVARGESLARDARHFARLRRRDALVPHTLRIVKMNPRPVLRYEERRPESLHLSHLTRRQTLIAHTRRIVEAHEPVPDLNG